MSSCACRRRKSKIFRICSNQETAFRTQCFRTSEESLLKTPDTGVLISPYPDQEGNKLEQEKILIFVYPIYNQNWRNISTIYIYI